MMEEAKSEILKWNLTWDSRKRVIIFFLNMKLFLGEIQNQNQNYERDIEGEGEKSGTIFQNDD